MGWLKRWADRKQFEEDMDKEARRLMKSDSPSEYLRGVEIQQTHNWFEAYRKATGA